MKGFKKLAGQTMVYGLGTMVPRLLNYIVLTPYFTYVLFADAQTEYGKVTELYAYITFLMIVLTYGMETTFFRYANTEKDFRKVYSTIQSLLIFTSVFFFLLVFVFTKQIAQTLDYSGESIFIRLLGGILAVEVITAIPFAKLRVEEKARKFAILKIVQVVLNIGILLGVYNFYPKIIGNNEFLLNSEKVISAQFIFISNLISSGIILLLILPEFKTFSFRFFERKYIKPFLVYGLPLLISGLAGTVNETLDRSLYKHIITDNELALFQLGIYGANYKIAAVILIFIQMFRYAAEPFFFNISHDKDSKQQYSDLMNIFVGVVTTMGLFILLFLRYFKMFIPESYHSGLTVVPYIVLAYLFYGIMFNLSVWFKLSNKTKYAIIITSIGALITIIINLFFVQKFQYKACAVAHVISYATMVVISYLLGQRFFKIKYNLKRIFGYIILAVIIYLVSRQFEIENNFINVFVRAVILLIFATFVFLKENLYKILKPI